MNSLVKTFITLNATCMPSGFSVSPGANVFSICTGAWPFSRISAFNLSVVPSPYTMFCVSPFSVVNAISNGVSFGLLTSSAWIVFSPNAECVVNSIGIMAGTAPSLPVTAVR